MKTDAIKYSILEDGTISIDTDEISGTNHASADELLKSLFDAMGGERTAKAKGRLGRQHAHTHDHAHGHDHGGHHHH